MKIKVSVDEDLCTGCAVCYTEVPEVFEDNGDGISQVKEDVGGDGAILEGELAEKVDEIKDECPVEAIIVEEVD
ncbi:MAG: ferredoxin [Deferribacterota bacterium]|nr:ferredoxin [Deferribacterota bacterium]